MNSYTGTKFYCTGTKLVQNPDPWSSQTYIEKPTFCMTRGYKNYLEQQKREKLETEISILRYRLEEQKRTEGEVDQIDLQNFIAKVKQLSTM